MPMLLTVTEAARELGLSRSSVYTLIRTDALPSLKIRRSRRVPWDAVVELVAASRAERDDIRTA